MGMFGDILGPVLGFTGDMIGNNQDKIASQRNRDFQMDIAEKNIALQREFAQQGVRWKVEDAKAAGIHPLYALGASTSSFAPVSVGGDFHSSGPAFRSMGQNLGRAIQAATSSEERELNTINLASAKADLEGKTLDNQIRATQLRNLNATSPALPGAVDTNFIPGQGNSNRLVKTNPAERTASQPGRPAQEAGWRPDVSFSRTDTGLTPMVPTSLSESLEDDIIGKLMWRVRNQLVPNLGGGGAPTRDQLPPGADQWYWSHVKQEWRPRYKGSVIRKRAWFLNE